MSTTLSQNFVKKAEELRESGDVRGALQILEMGLGQNPGFMSARYIRAKCNADLRRFADSLQELEEILQAVPDHLKARKLKVEIYLLLNQHRAAMVELTDLVERYPQDYEAVRALERLEDFLQGQIPASRPTMTRASTDHRLSGFQEARTASLPTSKESDFDTDEPAFATRTIAELYLRQGHKAKAKNVIKKILSENPGDTWAAGALRDLESESRLPKAANSATNAVTVKARKIRVLERLLARLESERSDSKHVI